MISHCTWNKNPNSFFWVRKASMIPPTLHCLSNSSYTSLFIHWAQDKLALSLFLKCSSISPGLWPLHQLCLCLQCIPSYLGRMGASGTPSDVTSSDDPCQKPTHSLAITVTYCNSLCSSCYLLTEFLFISLVLSCSVRRESLWDSRDLSIHPVSCSGMWKSCNKYLLFELKKEWTPDHQKWTKEPYLGAAFISTESQDCSHKNLLMFRSAPTRSKGMRRHWASPAQNRESFSKDPNCLDLQRPQDPLEKEMATHSSILA